MSHIHVDWRMLSIGMTISSLIALPSVITVLTAYSIAIVMVGTTLLIIVGHYRRELVFGP